MFLFSFYRLLYLQGHLETAKILNDSNKEHRNEFTFNVQNNFKIL